MLAGFTIDGLALVATMVDPVASTVTLEHRVREFSPMLARMLNPFPAVKLPRLRSAATLGMCPIGALKSLLPVTLDAIVLTL